MCGLCLLELLVGIEGAAGALDDVGGGPDAAPHPGLQVAALAVLRQEPAHEGVARAVGVHDLVRGQPLRREGPDLAIVLCSAPSVPQPVVQSQRRPLLGPSPG